MNDRSVLDQINELAEEEAHLREEGEGRGLSSEEERRLKSIEVHLDQCWDLLRQRRGRRDAGLNPGGAKVRNATTVERYQQ
jgi:hypothetical protein